MGDHFGKCTLLVFIGLIRARGSKMGWAYFAGIGCALTWVVFARVSRSAADKRLRNICLVIILVFAGGLKYQDIQQFDAAVEHVREVRDQMWCNNTHQIADFMGDGMSYRNEGGWPCIRVSYVGQVTEQADKNGDSELCANIALERQQGSPEEVLWQEWSFSRYCAPRSGSSVHMDWTIFETVAPALDQLNSDLCREYASRIGEDQVFKYGC